MSEYHVPVLLGEVLEHLLTDPDGLYVDGTLGGGGHAKAIEARLGPSGRLVGIDRDPEALAHSAAWALEKGDRVRLIPGTFGEVARILKDLGIGQVQGILLDLGVSSRQLDEGGRGFSFMRPGPLDMRMNPEAGHPASELVNNLPEQELIRIFREYGEEPRARRAAQAIVSERERHPILTTEALASTLEKALGRRSEKHPATRIFQALRIAVNRELEELEAFLRDFVDLLAPGGRVAVISYHSLEDRMVKQRFRELEPHCICPAQALRCTCGHPGVIRSVVRKAIQPSREETAQNPRARSARLRVAEKLTA